MRWDEVDLKAGVWHLPGARTKNGRPHSLPLPPSALALLERRRVEAPADAGAVFPGLTQWSDDHRALSAIHGGAYTWKDLRRTVSTRLAARGFSEEVIGRALNHPRYTVTARHCIKHGYEAEVRHALETWDADLADIVAGRERAGLRSCRFDGRNQCRARVVTRLVTRGVIRTEVETHAAVRHGTGARCRTRAILVLAPRLPHSKPITAAPPMARVLAPDAGPGRQRFGPESRRSPGRAQHRPEPGSLPLGA
jgi:hypothetical protein